MHSSILVHSIARNIKAAVEDILFAMARLLLFPDGVIKLIYIFIDNFFFRLNLLHNKATTCVPSLPQGVFLGVETVSFPKLRFYKL